MKSLGIRCIIHNDLHELYEIDPNDDVSSFPWLINYGQYEEDFQIEPTDHPENWHWVPISWKRIYEKTE